MWPFKRKPMDRDKLRREMLGDSSAEEQAQPAFQYALEISMMLVLERKNIYSYLHQVRKISNILRGRIKDNEHPHRA